MVWICIAGIIDSKLPVFFKNPDVAELVIRFAVPLSLGFIGKNIVVVNFTCVFDDCDFYMCFLFC
jgi:hypothetical protein